MWHLYVGTSDAHRHSRIHIHRMGWEIGFLPVSDYSVCEFLFEPSPLMGQVLILNMASTPQIPIWCLWWVWPVDLRPVPLNCQQKNNSFLVRFPFSYLSGALSKSHILQKQSGASQPRRCWTRLEVQGAVRGWQFPVGVQWSGHLVWFHIYLDLLVVFNHSLYKGLCVYIIYIYIYT